MGKRLKDCCDASHEKRLERYATDRSILGSCSYIIHFLSLLRIWLLGVLQRSSLSENLVKKTDRNATATDFCLLVGGPVNSRFCLTH